MGGQYHPPIHATAGLCPVVPLHDARPPRGTEVAPAASATWLCLQLFLPGRLRGAASPGSALRMRLASLRPTSGLSATGWGKAHSLPEDFCLITTILFLAQLNYLHLRRVSEHS